MKKPRKTKAAEIAGADKTPVVREAARPEYGGGKAVPPQEWQLTEAQAENWADQVLKEHP